MKVEYKVSVNGQDATPIYTAEVPQCTLTHLPDGRVIGNACEVDAVEEALCDLVQPIVVVQWKLPEDDDFIFRVREAEFPTWQWVGELCDRIEQLEKENAELKNRLT